MEVVGHYITGKNVKILVCFSTKFYELTFANTHGAVKLKRIDRRIVNLANDFFHNLDTLFATIHSFLLTKF